MNLSVCQKCRRFGGKYPGTEDTWLCAQNVFTMASDVIPGHSYFQKDSFHPVRAETAQCPTWCEYPLEQTILDASEKVNIETHNRRLVYDGNHFAEHHAHFKHERKKNW